jgi:kindlin 2
MATKVKMMMDIFAADVSMDWSDYGLWWPRKNMWLSRTRSTLDQYGVQADSDLEFIPMHKQLLVQLPDLQVKDLKVDFSKNVFNVVIKLCKEFSKYYNVRFAI